MVEQISYKKEIMRKSAHMICAALAIYIMYWAYQAKGRMYVTTGVFIVIILLMILDIFRIEFQKNIPIFSLLARKKESKRMIAITFAALGVMVMLPMFDFTITLTALAMGFFGDALAALVGRKWGKTKLIHGKSLEGSLANGITCFLIGFIFLSNPLLIGAMEITAMVVELVINTLEDNLYVPVMTGLVGQLLLLFF